MWPQLLRPHSLLRFLQAVHARVHPSGPLYFGSSSGGGGHAHAPVCTARDDEFCHTFRFNTGFDATKARQMRFRETTGFRRVEASMCARQSLYTHAPRASRAVRTHLTHLTNVVRLCDKGAAGVSATHLRNNAQIPTVLISPHLSRPL